METGHLTVLRPDAQELLAIRNGAWSYEKVIDYVQKMETKLDEIEERSPLPANTDKVAINQLYHETMERWDRDHERQAVAEL